MGLNNHAQRSTPPYYLDVDNPFDKKLFQFMSNEILKMVNQKKVLLLSEGKEFFIIFLHIMTRLYRVFFLKLAPPKFSKYKFPLYPLSLREISVLRKFRGGPVKKTTLYL